MVLTILISIYFTVGLSKYLIESSKPYGPRGIIDLLIFLLIGFWLFIEDYLEDLNKAKIEENE